MQKVREYAKFIVAIITAAVNAGALALLPDDVKVYVSIVLAVAGAIAVAAVPNAQPADEGLEEDEDLTTPQPAAADSGYDDTGAA